MGFSPYLFAWVSLASPPCFCGSPLLGTGFSVSLDFFPPPPPPRVRRAISRSPSAGLLSRLLVTAPLRRVLLFRYLRSPSREACSPPSLLPQLLYSPLRLGRPVPSRGGRAGREWSTAPPFLPRGGPGGGPLGPRLSPIPRLPPARLAARWSTGGASGAVVLAIFGVSGSPLQGGSGARPFLGPPGPPPDPSRVGLGMGPPPVGSVGVVALA